jgi:hypothetical protein
MNQSTLYVFVVLYVQKEHPGSEASTTITTHNVHWIHDTTTTPR